MQAGQCKIGYEVAWKGKRLICVGIYKGVVRFKHHETLLFLASEDTVHLPEFKAGLKCVEHHEGIETSEPFVQINGKVYVPWESLK